MTQNHDINARLTNWAAWATQETWSGGNSVTGLICERMRVATQGSESERDRVVIDEQDALLIERGMRRLLKPVRDLLKHHYVDGMRWQIICRRARVRVDREHFQMKLREAQGSIESAIQKRNDFLDNRKSQQYIPCNN